MIKSLILSGVIALAAAGSSKASCVEEPTLKEYRAFADEAEALKPKIIDKREFQKSLDNLRALLKQLEVLNLSPVKCKLLASRVVVTENDLKKMAKSSGVELE